MQMKWDFGEIFICVVISENLFTELYFHRHTSQMRPFRNKACKLARFDVQKFFERFFNRSSLAETQSFRIKCQYILNCTSTRLIPQIGQVNDKHVVPKVVSIFVMEKRSFQVAVNLHTNEYEGVNLARSLSINLAFRVNPSLFFVP